MASCFKLIVCAGDHHSHDLAIAAAGNEESTNSSDKRRWSFRRKSTSQRVIIHTVDANTSSGDRDSMDLVDQLIAPRESSSVMHLNNEESNMSMNVYIIDSSENQLSITANVEESAVTLIQTTVRRFLAQRELVKLKMLVKLQAVVRGHLVRQNAVRSLHCIQAIAMMQALVCAQYGKSSGNLGTEENTKVSIDSTSTISTPRCSCVPDKLLSNSFARQLLKSTRNPKHLIIKINPLSPSPLWSWMERWMYFASPFLDGPALEIENEQKTKEKGKLFYKEDPKVCSDGSYIEHPTPRITYGEIGTCNVINDGAIISSDSSTFRSRQEKQDFGFKKSGDAEVGRKMVIEKLKETKSDARLKWQTHKNLQIGNSLNNSPRTPSSQLINKSGRKSKDSSSSVKKSSQCTPDDFSASDSEQLHPKNDRRHTLGDISESDSGDNSLPRYMKATVSAKARLFASTSPRLSHDVLEKEISLTKRHSLPLMASAKQISPKLRQPSSGSGKPS